MSFNTYLKQKPACFSRRATALYTILSCLLAAILTFSGIVKLIDASGLLAALQQFSFLNDSLVVWIVTLLPVVELGVAIALIMQWKPKIILAATCLLFASFLGFATYGMAINLQGNCGCFGEATKSGFGWGMTIRNFVLFLAASYLLAATLTDKAAPQSGDKS